MTLRCLLVRICFTDLLRVGDVIRSEQNSVAGQKADRLRAGNDLHKSVVVFVNRDPVLVRIEVPASSDFNGGVSSGPSKRSVNQAGLFANVLASRRGNLGRTPNWFAFAVQSHRCCSSTAFFWSLNTGLPDRSRDVVLVGRTGDRDINQSADHRTTKNRSNDDDRFVFRTAVVALCFL